MTLASGSYMLDTYRYDVRDRAAHDRDYRIRPGGWLRHGHEAYDSRSAR
jgi:hypothetical protein